MDLQQILDNAVSAARANELKDSPILLLGELILKLEAVKNKSLPLIIDVDGKPPKGIDSWRGIYAELAIQADDFGSYQTDEIEREFSDMVFYKHKQIGKENPTVQEWIEVLEEAKGKTFSGYKGGDFTMSKNTPVHYAENGTCGDRFFVDVTELPDKVLLVTKQEESV